jgi:hypothetical protein
MKLRGLWLFLTGVLLLCGVSWEQNWRAKHETETLSGWRIWSEPSANEEGAILAGLISAGAGIVLLVVDLARHARRRRT